MFTKKSHIDLRKSMQKVLDPKKDSYSRLKHLKQCFECNEFDARGFFSTNNWDIYSTFFDTFSNLDVTLKQKGQKQTKEEQECALFIFEKILIHCSDLLTSGWHQHSTRFVLQRLLHHGNSIKVRQEGIRLFLIWYQILGLSSTADVQRMFASLVPGLVADIPNPFVNNAVAGSVSAQSFGSSSSYPMSSLGPPPPSPQLHQVSPSINPPVNVAQTPSYASDPRKKRRFPNGNESSYEMAFNPVIPTEIEPLPTYNIDLQPRDATCFYLQVFLDCLVSQVDKILWDSNRSERQRECFRFLFNNFKEVYLKNIFLNLDAEFSYYEPKFDLQKLYLQSRYENDGQEFPNKRFQHANTLLQCKAIVIKWLCRYLKSDQSDSQQSKRDDIGQRLTLGAGRPANPSFSQNQGQLLHQTEINRLNFVPPITGSASTTVTSEPNIFEYELVFQTLTSSRSNVNLMHQILGQVFQMPFTQSLTMRKVTMVYRDWIYKAYSRTPPFLLEPQDPSSSSPSSNHETNVAGGYSPFHRTFIIFSSSVFIQKLPDEGFSQLLDEQVEMCKRVLNIYRYMVMKVDMDRNTWEQLLMVILKITSIVLCEQVPLKKEHTLGGRLAPAFFETLIVTWIRANLNIHVSLDLWNEFKQSLSRLTSWEELIREWARTMDTLTRVMSRYVYNINLYDLPLERPVDRKQKRQTSKTTIPSKTATDNQPAPKIVNRMTSISDVSNQESNVRMEGEKEEEEEDEDDSEEGGKKSSSTSRGTKPFKSRANSNPSVGVVLRTKCLSDSSLHQKRRSKSMLLHRNAAPPSEIFLLERDTNAKDVQQQLLHNTSELWRSKSLENYESVAFAAGTGDLDDSEVNSVSHSRSPSPTSSSNNFENVHSLKEMQLHLDSGVNSSANVACSMSGSSIAHNTSGSYLRADTSSNRSVIAGGTYRNWSADSAILLWRRMLGILGDVNQISNPQLHFLIMECLAKIVEDFIKIRENLGVIIDGACPPKNISGTGSSFYPSLVPPMEYFVTWLFNATQLSDQYKGGKLIAFKLLCAIAIRRHEVSLEKNFLSVFYLTIHQGLKSYDLDIISVIIKYCGAKLFSFNLPAASCLLYDFTEACKLIVYSNETKKGIPRFEALCLLGTLIGMSGVYSEISALNPGEVLPNLTLDKNHEKFILEILVNAVKREKTSLGRAVAINALSIHLYQQLSNHQLSDDDKQIVDIFDLLIISVKFPNFMLARISSDALRLQCDHSNVLVQKHRQVPSNVILGLVSAIEFHLHSKQMSDNFKDFQNLILNLLMCLCDWCLALPKSYIQQPIESNLNEKLFTPVLKLLNDLMSTEASQLNTFASQNNSLHLPGRNPAQGRISIDFSISIDNLVENQNLNTKRRVDLQPAAKGQTFNQEPVEDFAQSFEVIRLAASMLLNHLINFVGHFPLPKLGPSRISCCVNEFDDNPRLIRNIDSNELTNDLFTAPNVSLFVVNNRSVVSFVDLGSALPNGSKTELFRQSGQVRIIVRDQIGKFAWTFTNIHSIQSNKDKFDTGNKSLAFTLPTANAYNEDDDIFYGNERLPDPLDALMQHLNEVSPECLQGNGSDSNDRSIDPIEENMIALLLNQHFQEMNYAENLSENGRSLDQIRKKSEIYHQKKQIGQEPNDSLNVPREFVNCRKLIDQLGLLQWEKRSKIELLMKNDRVLRELRNLDKQKCRETHKIAVIYVKEGQEDKSSILMNQSGSKEFEQFVSGLGWEVDLSRHDGFRGGLEGNLSTGKSAPYFANAFYEVIFHVSTRIPARAEPDSKTTAFKDKHTGSENADSNLGSDSNGDTENNEILNRKLRHLGNDEVHIVWSEHYRNYRRGIIPTEFCDILIVIYPIQSLPGYYRVTIFRKNEIPFFGPLFNGAVIHLSVLGGLVRATAINASRAQRSQVKYYQHYFQERFQCLDKICRSHQDLKSFEQFSATVYAPHQQQTFFNTSGPTTSVSSGSLQPQHSPKLLGQSNSNPTQFSTSSTAFNQSSHFNQQQQFSQNRSFIQGHNSTTASKPLSRQVPIVSKSIKSNETPLQQQQPSPPPRPQHYPLTQQKSAPKTSNQSHFYRTRQPSNTQTTYGLNEDTPNRMSTSQADANTSHDKSKAV